LYAAPRLVLYSFPNFFLCLSRAFKRSGGGGGTRHSKCARHGLQQLRLRPCPQPPGHDYQENEKCGLLPGDPPLSADFSVFCGASRRPFSCRPLRRTMGSSRWRSWTRPLAPRLMPLALIRDSVTRPHVSPPSASFPHLTHLSLSVQRLRSNLWVGRRRVVKRPLGRRS
jgi:hypothetical protein